MGGAKMMNKKASSTMTSVFITILLTMALFYSGYSYINSNYVESGITDTLGYNQSYADLQTAQANLSQNIEDIKSSGQGIVEANANVLLIAWNGLTGLAGTMRLFFSVIDVGINVFNALVPALVFLPAWVKLLVEMGLIITVVLIIIGAFKGETKS